MRADEDERREVREMNLRRDAENASEQIVQPTPVQPATKSRWSAHKDKAAALTEIEDCASLETPVDVSTAKHLSATTRSPHAESGSEVLYEVCGSTQLCLERSVSLAWSWLRICISRVWECAHLLVGLSSG